MSSKKQIKQLRSEMTELFYKQYYPGVDYVATWKRIDELQEKIRQINIATALAKGAK